MGLSQSRLPALLALGGAGAGLSWWLWQQRCCRQAALTHKLDDVTADAGAPRKSNDSVTADEKSGGNAQPRPAYSINNLLHARQTGSDGADLGFRACQFGENGAQETSAISSNTDIVLDPVRGTRPIVYCDLDGVLCDFEGAVSTLFKRPYAQIKKGTMWKRLSEARDFYAKLDWLTEGSKLWEGIQSASPVILSGVPQDWGTSASAQKRQWVRKKLGEQVPILTCLKEDKWKMCRPGDIIIDDNADLRQAWEKAGGIFVHYDGDASICLSQLAKVSALPPPPQLMAVKWIQVRWDNDWWWCKLLSEEAQGANVEFMEPPHVGYKFLAPSRHLRRPR